MAQETWGFLWPAVTHTERRVSKLLHVVSEQNRATFSSFFLPVQRTQTYPSPHWENQCHAGSAANFCSRAASSLVSPHRQQGPGLTQFMLLCTWEGEKVVEKRLWRVNLDVALPSAVRDVEKRCAVTRRSKLHALILAEAALAAELPNYKTQAKMSSLLFWWPEPFLSLIWLQLALFSHVPRSAMQVAVNSTSLQCCSAASSDWFCHCVCPELQAEVWKILSPFCLIFTCCVLPMKPS